MSTLEATIAMLESLPESDVKAIHDITYRIFEKNSSPLRPVSKKAILEDLGVSRNQIEKGEFKDAEEAVSDIEVKYDL